MAVVDVCIFLPEGNGDEKRRTVPARTLRSLEGVDEVSSCGGGRVLHVTYEAERTTPKAMLHLLERTGWRAKLIGL
jgi:hypothetical protein